MTTAISGEVAKPLQERIKDDEHAVEHIKTDVRSCGILVFDPIKSGALKFAHKSFMEYLFATVVANKILRDIEGETSIQSTGAIYSITDIGISDIFEYGESVSFLVDLLVGRLNELNEEEKVDDNDIAYYLYEKIVLGYQENNVLKTIEYLFMKYYVLTGIKLNPFRKDIHTAWLLVASIPFFILTIPILFSKQLSLTSNFSFLLGLLASTSISLVLFLSMLVQMFRVSSPLKSCLTLWFLCCRSQDISEFAMKKAVGGKVIDYLKEYLMDS